MSVLSPRDLESVVTSLRRAPNGGFLVDEVPHSPGYRVGLAESGAVVLLTPSDTKPGTPTRLRELSLDPSMLCEVEGLDGVRTTEKFGVIQFSPSSPELFAPFYSVCAAFIRLLGPAPAPTEVTKCMKRLVRLFASGSTRRGSVLGLWAELLTIDRATSPADMIDAWHDPIDERFDFSSDSARLEVKATTKPTRVHHFGLRQLQPVDGVVVNVVSVMTARTSPGCSLLDLVARVEAKLVNDAERQMKLHEVVAMTLGDGWEEEVASSFDEAQAAASLVLIKGGDLPHLPDVPGEILDAELVVDCSGLPVSATSLVDVAGLSLIRDTRR